MKKKILLPFLILFMSEAFIFASPIGFDFLLMSGLPLYGDGSITETKNDLVGETANRVVVGTSLDMNVALSDIFGLLFGAEIRSDFNWQDSYYYNHLDYNFFTGLSVCPWDIGVIFSVAYALGCRSDFLNGNPNAEVEGSSVKLKDNSNASWGNGFRVSVEYDILHTWDVAVSPCFGVLYEFFPRGDNFYDNLISFYAGLKF